MTINVGQIIGYVVGNFPIFLMIGAIVVFIFAVFNIEIRPPKVQVAEKITPVRILILVAASILFIVGFLSKGLLLLPPTQPSPTATANRASVPTATVNRANTPTATVNVVNASTDKFASNLIPVGQAPTLNDPLKDNSQGYGWDEETLAGGSCLFAQGHYLLSAPAGDNNGIGCNSENARGIFSNFVYQIEMTILTGVDNGQSGAGPIFRVNTAGSGQQYQVDFNVSGNWEVTNDSKTLTSVSTPCGNPCPFFMSGANQSNVITISASGSNIQIQINGHPLGTYTDSTYASGYIGVQMSPGTENSSVAFSNARVWKL